jgi:hypothetical protein
MQNDATDFDPFRLWPILAAIATAAIIFSSVLYDWSYFQAIYPPALSLLSLSDHVATGIRWLPGSLIGMVLSGIVPYFMKSQSTVSNSTIKPPWSPRRWLIVGITAPILYLVVRQFFVPQDWVVISAVITISVMYLIASQLEKAKVGMATILMVMIFIILGGFAISGGDLQAMQDMTKKDGDTTVVTKGGDWINGLVVLRFLDKGILVREPTIDHAMLITWDVIERVDLNDVKWDYRWNSCVEHGWFCGHP